MRRRALATDLATYYKFDSLLCLDSADYDLYELRNMLVERFDLPEKRGEKAHFEAIGGAGGIIRRCQPP